MKNLLRRFIRQSNLPDPSKEICTHQSSGLSVDEVNKQLVFLSKDHCKSCGTHVCNVCSESHITEHCKVELGLINTEAHQKWSPKLKSFNYGSMMKLQLKDLYCTCGKKLELHKKEHAICAACGMASCSDHCHQEWEQAGNCTYHQHFHEPNPAYNLRSIRLDNILNIQKSKIKGWSVAQKTSLSYVSCYASKVTDYVYLQRGYRNYGNPQPQLIEAMEPQPFGLDFTTHIERLCDCECDSCSERSVHSKGNCEYVCGMGEYLDTLSIKEEYHKQCECTCAFCSSGVVVGTHRKIDCVEHCYKSEYNFKDIV